MNRLLRYWKRFKQNRYFLKVVSVFLSVLLWFFVLNSQPVEIRKKIRIKYIMPSEMSFVKEPKREVNVIYRGPRAYARGKSFENMLVTIDLSDHEGRQRIKLNKSIKTDNIPASFGLDLESYSPKEVVVELDRTIFKTVPLIIDFEGKVKDGFKLVSAEVSPKNIAIEGPLEIMRKVKKLRTGPIFLSELFGKEKRKILIQDLPSEIALKEDATHVSVSTEVRPIVAKVVERKLKIKFLSGHQKFKTKAKYTSVRLSLSEKEFRNNKLDELYAVADIPDRKDGKVFVNLKVDIPNDIQLLEIKPKRILIDFDQ